MRTRPVAHFVNAIAFLSRLPCGCSHDFKAALPYFGAAGLLISSLALAPVLFWLCVASFSIQPFALAMLASITWLFFEVMLTGGMHWDGVADLADASVGNPERFRKVLADPHIGAFGVLIVTLLALLQTIAAACCFYPFIESACKAWSAFLPVLYLALSGWWSRLFPIFLAWRSHPFDGSKLGALVCSQTTTVCLMAALVQATACIMLLYLLKAGIANLCLLAIGQLFLVICFRAQAEKHGGMSGDFMGAGIVCSQTLFLLLAIP